MKKIITLLMVVFLGVPSIFAVCKNNKPGCKHAQKRDGTYEYKCPCKTKKHYGRSQAWFYTKDVCKHCGCSDDKHDNMTN